METTKKTFKGGFAFTRFGGNPQAKLESIGLPDSVMYPLPDAAGLNEALVSKGDTVKAGQLLWQNDEITGNPIISTINGTVESVKPVVWKDKKISVITVSSDGTDTWTPVKGKTEDPFTLDRADIEETLYFAGIAALGRDGIPTRFNSSSIKPEDVKYLIIKHCEDEVYNVDLSVLLADKRLEDFNQGLSLLKKIMPEASSHLVINRKNSQWISRFAASPFDEMIQVKPKYPQGMDEIVTETVTGKKIPAVCTPANASAIVLDVQAVLHVFDALKFGKPLIEQIVTLAGPGFTNRSHVKLRIGTTYEQIVKGRTAEGENRFIINSAMTGVAVTDMTKPIEPDCSALIALEEGRVGELMLWVKPGLRKHSIMNTMANALIPLEKINNTNANGEERACLSCGNCYNTCPAGLYPTQLFKYVERDRVDETVMKYGILKCIDCNLCTYVCTAKIPLADFIKKGKAKLFEDGYISIKEILSAYDLKETES
ncbi:MAG: 4Fe-4S dicluster domain-containing protein [Spirochaetaceae bacterium]|jgi:electron transport complex protein RnfC|nr:4Fe-4S dicluster domain-containing protein [Spirochaetaceae bacterium]